MAEVSSQTLHIVARELASELNEARAALEAFGEQQDNLALLRKCKEHLHSVHGALRVSEVYGAALLAEEMGQVAGYLIDNFAEKRHLAEGLDALMRAMVQLPTYLERVLSGGRDMALVLLPLLNDLRAVRGHALLSEGTLLLLNLSSDQQANPSPSAPGEVVITVSQWARRLRTRFQLGLLGWIKGERVDQNLEILSRAAEKLEQVATTQAVFQLWWVAGAILEALREAGLEGTASIKRLLGQADREMKRLYELSEARYAETPPLELLNNLLYYVARATTSGPRVGAVRASFRLTELLPVDDHVEQARESLSAPSVKLMKTVAAAIKEDLGRVKDALDIFVRQGGTQTDELAPQLELLKKIGDTLGVLGLGELRDKVQGETGDLQAIVTQQAAANEGTLLRMAATLIKVEDSLDEQLVGMIVPSPAETGGTPSKPAGPDEIEFRQVTEAVLRECIVNMARIKEAISQSVEKPRETQVIDQIPQLVRGITAGLLMLGKTRAVEIMEGIARSLTQFVGTDGMTLPQEAVDRLADAIVAIEYYMETLQAGRADPWYMLDNAETCLQFLAEAQPVSHAEAFAGQTVDPIRTLVIEPLSQTIVTPTEQERTAVLDRAQPAPASRGQPPVPAPALAKPVDREIDPEFLELFIEEAKDEIVKLKKLFPLWDENPQDQESLVNVRRSFHTLKGSGRMVGAQLIGEFAWSVENVFNRVINKTLERTPDMMSLLRQAVETVPELVEQLETGRAPHTDVAKLIHDAQEISGVRPNVATAAAPTPRAAPPAAAPAVRPAPVVAPAARGPTPAPSPQMAVASAAEKKTAAERMDPALHDIYAKETAGHLATIRDFIAACDQTNPPYAVTEDLHRSCHTLSGTAKTAGARQGIKIAEPLNRYIRKLYDNSVGMPKAGLDSLKDAVAAIQQVVDHIDEDTGFFLNHALITVRLHGLEEGVDHEISRLAETLDIHTPAGADEASATPDVEVADILMSDDSDGATDVLGTDVYPGRMLTTNDSSGDSPQGSQAQLATDEPQVELTQEEELSEIIELEPTDARTLEALDWSFKNFPSEAPVDSASTQIAQTTGETVEVLGLEEPLPADEGGGIVVEEMADDTDDTTRSMKKLPPGFVPKEALADVPESPTEIEPAHVSFDSLVQPDAQIEVEPPAVERAGFEPEEPPVTEVANDLDIFVEPEEPPTHGLASEMDSLGEPEVPQDSDTAIQALATESELPQDTQIAEAGISVEEAISVEESVLAADAIPEFEAAISDEAAIPDEGIEVATTVEGVESELESVLLAEPPAEPPIAEPPPPTEWEAPRQEVAPPAPPMPPSEAPRTPAPATSSADDNVDHDFDPDVAAIFTEEAQELLEVADQSLSSWRQDRSNDALVFELKRVLHTLKGGARMAGIRAMGDLSHELESFMELVEAGQVAAEPAVFDALQASLDELHRMREVVNQGQRCAPASELISRIRRLAGHEPEPEPAPVAAQAPVAAAPPPPAAVVEVAAPPPEPEEPDVEYEAPSVTSTAPTGVVPTLTESLAEESDTALASDESVEIDVEFGADELGAAAPREAVRIGEPPAVATGAHATLDVAALSPELPPDPSEAEADAAAEAAAPALPPGREPQAQERQEFARVDADLLDTLLNNAGEVSIFRSRLEQQVSSIEFNLAELGRTVTRLKEQLRKMELETEAQILHRHEAEHPGRADFDPLELDRYSLIQQLSRAFAESVSDVGSIEGLLENLTREAQNLLLQQSRVVTELQNGLMRTRMVPFQRHVQRLSRLVRQVATDTGKRCELVVTGASGELDRQVLERMLPPFEHMLRNSVVHGIEAPQERLARGKPENGTIRVGLHREGSEMVIVLEDDGRGIDVNAVRERARARGLLQPGRVLSDEEALQLILEPGFSTASTVTQHAGRGVGMDVVVTEIKKLGGALFTESQPGKGVKFTIRLPFTLAITQALIVRAGEELYALPLPSVEGVARVPRSEVQKHLAEESPTFSYGGQIYRFQHLGAFVGGGPSLLPEVEVSVPVILIRAGEHSTAVVMDELVGSREMVVKSVGPQIASIRGISGATILGDGRIVIILDLGALARSEWRGRAALQAAGPVVDKRTFALVVDDSITVRRVTQRLLERNGMRVMTAKDGVDALSILQEHVPDVILLDIEMPRMDGYEFASHVRSDTRFAEIPIVMITSRVGEKHRARAIELGVNDYLGKPYQENQLLDAIEPLVQARRRKVS